MNTALDIRADLTQPNADSIPAVAVSALTVRFGELVAVDSVSFEVPPGEVYGLLGPNGAGKTTTIRVLTTLLPPTSGRTLVFGLDVRRNSMAVRQSIGYVPQQLGIDAALTGWENVWLFARLFTSIDVNVVNGLPTRLRSWDCRRRPGAWPERTRAAWFAG